MSNADAIIARLRTKAAGLRGLGYKVQFSLTDTGEHVLLDATGSSVTVEEGEGDADTTLLLTSADLLKLAAGKLSPMLAFATGRLKVEGSKGVAMKLASLLDED